MKIEVKIIARDDEENLGWSEPIEIDEFIVNPNDIEFRWKDGSTLPYNDFIFFGSDYYYGIFINDKNINDYSELLEKEVKE